MKIVVIQKAGEDYPQNCKDNWKFYEGQKRNIRRRLQLRENDVVEIRELIENMVDKKCPKCDSDMVSIFFMGDKSRPPEFLACRKCNIAYDPDTLKVLANVIF